jgi:hypothetical protein
MNKCRMDELSDKYVRLYIQGMLKYDPRTNDSCRKLWRKIHKRHKPLAIAIHNHASKLYSRIMTDRTIDRSQYS